MQCPHCKTENRDDRAECYHCGRDLTLLRLMMNRAKAHFNTAVDHVKEDNYYEALGELNAALELNSRMAEGHLLRGSILARLERSEEAREALERALELEPNAKRAHRYLLQLDDIKQSAPLLGRLRQVFGGAAAVVVISLAIAVTSLAAVNSIDVQPQVTIQPFLPNESDDEGEGPSLAERGWSALQAGRLDEAFRVAQLLRDAGQGDGLMRALTADLESRFLLAESFFREESYRAAAEELGKIDSQNLPENYALRYRTLADSLGEKLFAEWRALALADEVAESGDRERLAALIEQYFPGRVGAMAPIREMVNKAREQRLGDFAFRAEALAQAKATPADIEAVRNMANAYAEERGIDAAETLAKIDQIHRRALTDSLLAQYAEAGENFDFPWLEDLEEQIAAIQPLPEGAANRLGRLQAQLRESFEGALATQLAAGEIEEAVRLAAEFQKHADWSPAGNLAEHMEDARKTLALDAYYALVERSEALESGALTPSEAEWALRRVEEARGPLPSRLKARAREFLHFAAAAAHRTLGQDEAAQREIAALKRQFPGSAWLLAWE